MDDDALSEALRALAHADRRRFVGAGRALLESSELIVRGAAPGRVALSTLTDVTVAGDALTFWAAGERVELTLGAAAARRWADAILAPPPTLAHKLGITARTRVALTGHIDDDALADALAGAQAVTCGADLEVVRAHSVADLAAWHAGAGAADVPFIWIVYPKGRTSPLPEGAVREFMRGRGFTDTKVASISGRLTALRFTRRPDRIC